MATLKPFLDLRVQRKKDELYPLKISVSATRSIVFQIPVKIYLAPENWNSQTCRIVKHKSKRLFNMALQEQLLSLEKKLTVLEVSGQLANMSTREVKQYLVASQTVSCSARGDLIDYYEQYIDRIANASTRGTHEHTLKKSWHTIKESCLSEMSIRLGCWALSVSSSRSTSMPRGGLYLVCED